MVKQLKKTIEMIQGCQVRKHSLDDLLQQVHRAEVDADDDDAIGHSNNDCKCLGPKIITEIRGMERTIPIMC